MPITVTRVTRSSYTPLYPASNLVDGDASTLVDWAKDGGANGAFDFLRLDFGTVVTCYGLALRNVTVNEAAGQILWGVPDLVTSPYDAGAVNLAEGGWDGSSIVMQTASPVSFQYALISAGDGAATNEMQAVFMAGSLDVLGSAAGGVPVPTLTATALLLGNQPAIRLSGH